MAAGRVRDANTLLPRGENLEEGVRRFVGYILKLWNGALVDNRNTIIIPRS
jgi:hypothetical protein